MLWRAKGDRGLGKSSTEFFFLYTVHTCKYLTTDKLKFKQAGSYRAGIKHIKNYYKYSEYYDIIILTSKMNDINQYISICLKAVSFTYIKINN
jgi:hypothetical protein